MRSNDYTGVFFAPVFFDKDGGPITHLRYIVIPDTGPAMQVEDEGVFVTGIIIFGQQEPVGHALKIQSLKSVDDFGFDPGSPVAGLVLGI